MILESTRDVVVAAEVSQTPLLGKKIVARALSGIASPRGAIKARCLQCVGHVRKDIENCTALSCALWMYRPFQKDGNEAPIPASNAD